MDIEMGAWQTIIQWFAGGGTPANWQWIIVVAILVSILSLFIKKPVLISEWKAHLSTLVAYILKAREKHAFSDRLGARLDRARAGLEKEVPGWADEFLPYGIKVKWVDVCEQEDQKEKMPRFEEDKVIVYANTLDEEMKRFVGALHHYCIKGLGKHFKYCMDDATREASDLLRTGRLARFAGPEVNRYFQKQYLDTKRGETDTWNTTYERLKAIDNDGLFLSVYINEVDKFVAQLPDPARICQENQTTINNWGKFLYIASKEPEERVKLRFIEDGIRVLIVLAVGDRTDSEPVESIVARVQRKLRDGLSDTCYVLASGTKIREAKDIAERIYNNHWDLLHEKLVSRYVRYTRTSRGVEAICIEIRRWM